MITQKDVCRICLKVVLFYIDSQLPATSCDCFIWCCFPSLLGLKSKVLYPSESLLTPTGSPAERPSPDTAGRRFGGEPIHQGSIRRDLTMLRRGETCGNRGTKGIR